MKATLNENIMQLDITTGGGIISESIRVESIDNPILVIGLGGTGIDSMLRLKYQINRRFLLPENPFTKRKDEKPKNIEFIGFETNMNEKMKAYPERGGVSLDPNNELVMLANANIGAILKNRNLMDSCIKDWLSPEINAADGTNGAGGCRQIGRLLLFNKSTEVVQSLRKKINTIMEGSSEKLLVFILTGVSGGTGSGCFLDIPYIVRGIMNEKFGSQGDDKLKIFGYLYTPDVNVAKIGLDEHTKDNIVKNGYAALKELDYWMNVQERKEKFKQRYMNVIEVNSGYPPYDMCHLISATNTDGVLMNEAYDYCMNVTAENIVNFIASEKKVNDQFAFMDYISNIDQLVKGMNKPYNANYKYSIVGASCAVLPIEDITTFLAFKLFGNMQGMFLRAPESVEIRDFINEMGIDEQSLSRKFDSEVRQPLDGYENSSRFSFDNIFKTQSINVDDELKDYLESANSTYTRVRNNLPSELVKEFDKHIERVFKDSKKGPFYASRLILSENHEDVIKSLTAVKTKLEGKLPSLKQSYDDLSREAQNRFFDAKKVKLVGKSKKKNEYLAGKRDEYMARANYIKTRKMIELYDDIIFEFNHLNSKIYGVYKEILTKLKEIFEKDGKLLQDMGEYNTKAGSKYYWNVVNVDDLSKKIDKEVRELDTDAVIMDFSDKLLSESEKWINEEEVDIANSISSFITSKFGSIINSSMEDFLKIKYGEDKPIDKLIESSIAPRLDRDAVPVFHLENSSYNLSLPSWGLVSIPANTPTIKEGIKSYREKAANGRSHFTIKISEVKNKVFWLNTKNGVPLYAYAPLSQYEIKYEETIFKHEGIGRHLQQNERENWAYLPSPIPEESWAEEYMNKRVKEYNNSLRDLFDKALQFNCIRLKDGDNKLSANYEVVKTEDLNINALLSKHEVELEANNTVNFEKISDCYNELKKLMEYGIMETARTDVFSSSNINIAKSNFIRSPKLVEIVREEVKKYKNIEAVLRNIEDIRNSATKGEELFDNFFQALITNTLCKKGLFFVYDQAEGEKGDWEPFVNLMLKNKYPEYHAYVKYLCLDEEHMNILSKKSEDRFGLVSKDTEKISALINKNLDMYSVCTKTLEEVKSDFVNGEEIFNFYKMITDKLNDIKNIL